MEFERPLDSVQFCKLCVNKLFNSELFTIPSCQKIWQIKLLRLKSANITSLRNTYSRIHVLTLHNKFVNMRLKHDFFFFFFFFCAKFKKYVKFIFAVHPQSRENHFLQFSYQMVKINYTKR